MYFLNKTIKEKDGYENTKFKVIFLWNKRLEAMFGKMNILEGVFGHTDNISLLKVEFYCSVHSFVCILANKIINET